MSQGRVASLAESCPEPEFGGKAAQLCAATRAGLPVPRGFALSFEATERVVHGDAELRERVCTEFERLASACAVRSSAIGEDSALASFAGQHATVLNVTTPSELVAALEVVWRSARSDAAMSYRRKLGVTAPPRMGVVVQELVDSDCAGVLFTRNPLSGDDERVIEAAWGLGEIVVAGLVTPDRYRVARDGVVLERVTGEKDIAIRRASTGGTEEAPVAQELISALCLDDTKLAELHALASACERHFGADLDLEWAYRDDALVLLQQRKITSSRGEVR